MLRLFFIILIIYLAAKLVKFLLFPPPKQTQVKGRPVNKKPLDLSGKDVEDAEFEEIDE